jgi:uncharacterized paraquat-inducible protein A
MSRKKLVQCPGSGMAAAAVTLAANPKANCPRCSKRCEVTSVGRIRKHMTFKRIKGGK